jgi:hypothetical protein
VRLRAHLAAGLIALANHFGEERGVVLEPAGVGRSAPRGGEGDGLFLCERLTQRGKAHVERRVRV